MRIYMSSFLVLAAMLAMCLGLCYQLNQFSEQLVASYAPRNVRTICQVQMDSKTFEIAKHCERM